MAEETVYMRTARKALEAVGGADALAAALPGITELSPECLPENDKGHGVFEI